ncbi:MAG: sugar transferase [Acidobacteria bacterium]|nr:sugar transferase [Acidobacteriota bacterium]
MTPTPIAAGPGLLPDRGGACLTVFSSHWRLLRVSIASSLVVFLTLAATLFLLKLDLSRSFLILFCSLVGLFLSAQRFLVLRLLRMWRRQGKNFRNIIICGVGEQAQKLAGQIVSQPELGLLIRGFVDLGGRGPERSEQFKRALRSQGYTFPVRVVDGATGLHRALTEYAVDEVIFTDIVDVMPLVEEGVVVCAEQGVRTTIAADLFSMGMVKSGLSYFGDMPLIHFQTPPGDRWELTVKRVLDILISAVLLVLLSPVFLVVALAVRASSPGPVIFRQTRVGLNGRLFELLKFRSMVADSEEQLAALREKNEMEGPVFKMKEDPRVTPVGKILRRYSLDELPQLWNVLRGEMSIVGPRPPVPGEVSMYERRDRRRLSMRPGITCIWQVSGRSEIRDFESWVRLDLEYIDNWSLSRDISLMLRTIPAVLLGRGAH